MVKIYVLFNKLQIFVNNFYKNKLSANFRINNIINYEFLLKFYIETD